MTENCPACSGPLAEAPPVCPHCGITLTREETSGPEAEPAGEDGENEGRGEAVPAYHGVLQGLGIQPYRSLEDDMRITTGVMSYGSNGSQVRVPAPASPPTRVLAPASPTAAAQSAPARPAASNNSPNFATMSPDQRLAYFRSRLNGA